MVKRECTSNTEAEMCIFKRCIDSLKIEVASISTYCVIEMLPLGKDKYEDRSTNKK
jgi:hypothetical protein